MLDFRVVAHKPKMCPWDDFGTFWDDPRDDFGTILGRFGDDPGDDFGTNLGRFGDDPVDEGTIQGTIRGRSGDGPPGPRVETLFCGVFINSVAHYKT